MAVTTVTIKNSVDTWIDNTNATSNFGTNADMYVGEYGFGSQIARGLIKWDLSSIPSGSTIIGARIRIRDIGTNLATNTRTLRVYRCLRAWVETEATWNNYSTGNAWGTAGAGDTTTDRESTDIGSFTFPATEVTQFYDIQLNASKIDEMFDGTFSNNGFVLKMDTETDDMHRFYTNNNVSLQPELVIDYVTAGEFGILLNPSKDCHMTNGASANTNQDSTSLDVGEYNGAVNDIRRTLIQFDFTSIPQNAVLTSVKVRLFDQASNLSDNTRTMELYRCLRTWGETTVTWNKYDGTNSWTTAGADDTTSDRESAVAGSVSMPDAEVLGYVDITVTPSYVQDWISGRMTNNGFLIKMQTETNDLHRFWSSEGDNQPQMILSYGLSGGFFLVL